MKLTVAYDGTDFHGWQSQTGLRTVEGTLLDALEGLLGERPDLHAASRTDRGVHAAGQVANFGTDAGIPTERILRALNGRLPGDVRVRSAEEAPEGFHARFSAVGKHYRYVIDRREVPGVFLSRRALHVPGPLDLERLEEAARALVGEHDFAAFACAGGASGDREKTTVRAVYGVFVVATDDVLVLDFWGRSFLYKMVRVLAGSLLEVARGSWTAERLRAALESRDRRQAGPTLPARGLCLQAVYYDPRALEAAVESAAARGGRTPGPSSNLFRDLVS